MTLNGQFALNSVFAQVLHRIFAWIRYRSVQSNKRVVKRSIGATPIRRVIDQQRRLSWPAVNILAEGRQRASVAPSVDQRSFNDFRY